MAQRVTGLIAVVFTLAICVTFFSTQASAGPASTNFKFDETSVGAGGQTSASSASYLSQDAISDIGVGNSASTNYQIEEGSKTTYDPNLSFAINSSAVSFGAFSASTATVTTATFSVLNYTSYGYVVQLTGAAPTNGATTIPGMPTTTAPTTGVSQFGVNLVANTVPSSIGANPNNGQFGFGQAATNYNTPNQYRYVSGETIAQAPKSSGLTTYTITYLVNVAPLTPGGQYNSDQTIIVTGTY